MNGNLNNTSKQEYKAPMINCEELEKYDVLTESAFILEDDNKTVKSASYLGGYDLFDTIFD